MVLPPPLSVLAHSLLSLNTFPVYWPIITPSIDHLEGLLPDCLSAVLNALSSSTDRTGLRTVGLKLSSAMGLHVTDMPHMLGRRLDDPLSKNMPLILRLLRSHC